jgi:Domain of unknown function (DUF6487)
MQPDQTRCSECGGEMELGVILDNSDGRVDPQKWARGNPDKSWLGGLKIKKGQFSVVDTYRCKVCGYLKSYAK